MGRALRRQRHAEGAGGRVARLEWVSLSHVALPFRADDPLYGSQPPDVPSPIISLGRLSLRGENAVLTVPTSALTRISWNPFFSYMSRRIGEFVEATIVTHGPAKP